MENPLVLKPDAIDVDHQKGALTSSPQQEIMIKKHIIMVQILVSFCVSKDSCRFTASLGYLWNHVGSPLKFCTFLFVGFLRFHLIRRSFLWSLFFLGGRRLVPRGFRPATPVDTAIQLCLGTLILGFFLGWNKWIQLEIHVEYGMDNCAHALRTAEQCIHVAFTCWIFL